MADIIISCIRIMRLIARFHIFRLFRSAREMRLRHMMPPPLRLMMICEHCSSCSFMLDYIFIIPCYYLPSYYSFLRRCLSFFSLLSLRLSPFIILSSLFHFARLHDELYHYFAFFTPCHFAFLSSDHIIYMRRLCAGSAARTRLGAGTFQ